MSAALKVLVVHDDRDMRAAVGELLRSEGFDVVEAADGLEALLQVKRSRPAGVVLDLVMPRLGGLDAIKRIRAFDRAIKIVVITGAPDRELHQQARALGAAAVLTKPLSPTDVVAALRAETAPPAPVESAPSLSVESALLAPVESAPSAPVESVPSLSVESALAALVESAPLASVESAPLASAESAPLASAESAPLASAESTPPAPLESAALGPAESAPPAPAPEAPSVAAAASAVPEILVVASDPELRDSLQELLAAAGYKVRLMSDAASGVRAIVERAPHLVLLDVEMPGRSGVGMLPTIVALVPAAKVIMLNERAHVDLAQRTRAFGAFDHVTKPIDRLRLLRSIEAALRQRRVDLAG